MTGVGNWGMLDWRGYLLMAAVHVVVEVAVVVFDDRATWSAGGHRPAYISHQFHVDTIDAHT